MKLDADTRARFEELVGKLSETQEHFVAKAMVEHASGVWRIALQINGRLDFIAHPVQAFMKSLNDGAHIARADTQIRSRVYTPAPRLSDEEVAYYNEIAAKWRTIQHWMTHPIINEMYWEIAKTFPSYSEVIVNDTVTRREINPTDAQAKIMSDTLIYAIGELRARSQ